MHLEIARHSEPLNIEGMTASSTLCFELPSDLEQVVAEYCIRSGLTMGEFLEMATRELADQLIEL